MAKVYQRLQIKQVAMRKKNGQSKGTFKRVTVSKKRTINTGKKVYVKKQTYSGKPSRTPIFNWW